MFLSKKSMFKDGSIFLILVQSGTMLHFPGYISSSRQSLDNLFTFFERTYVGVVFDIKIPAGNHYVFPEERLKKSPKFDFSWDAFSGYTVWRAGNENRSTGNKLYNMTKTALFIFIRLCLCFIAKIFFVLLVR